MNNWIVFMSHWLNRINDNMWTIMNNGKHSIFLFSEWYLRTIDLFSLKHVIDDTVRNLSEKSLNEVQEDLRRIFDDDSILPRHCIEDYMKYLQIYHHLQCHWNNIRKIKSPGTLCDLLSVSFHFLLYWNNARMALVDWLKTLVLNMIPVNVPEQRWN